jgi:indolepyruvate ferredoxin oxidoreductase
LPKRIITLIENLNDTIKNTVNLSDKYTAASGTFYMTGIQALVRLPLDQMAMDAAAGLRTGAFISGYEGSPLGGYDLALQRVSDLLAKHNIHFRPGVNEDLAATAILGSQIVDVAGEATVDGVVGIWYGKGPGLDRSHDALRHANLAGCPKQSAALVLAGDDHASKSSTIPHQSDFSLMNLGIPTLMPANAQEVLDLGLAAIAMSRYSGAWTALKLTTNICDGGGSVRVDRERRPFLTPEGYEKSTDPMLVIPNTLRMEAEMSVRRLAAAKAFARANRLDRVTHDSPGAKIGFASAGKPYFDLIAALEELGVLGQVRVAKYAMTFPVDEKFTREFAADLDVLVVVEEKRSFLEMQIREALFNEPRRPAVRGKDLLPPYGELDPDLVANAIAPAFGRSYSRKTKASGPWRRPNFCSGCPHNRSTILLEGQLAGGGTGCHGMAVMLGASGRGFVYATHMGGEGAPWIGMSPFTKRRHMFQNIGDGTYFHSGSLAVEACVAAGVNITFKLLYNGHVAMTGGQDSVGARPVPELTQELAAKGVRKTIVLVEDPARYTLEMSRFAKNAEVRDRAELEATLAELERTPGVTVLIYDQECAAEKRRRRSRGLAPEPEERLYIHPEVCEGCGDCVTKSNCASLQWTPTALGEKMQIHQSSCNKDYTCAFGDCPSFVTRREKPGERKPRAIPEPPAVAEPEFVPWSSDAWRIVMPGVGGTGVVTINAILATAAVMDGLWTATLDQTGLAQKGGAVTSHLTLARAPVATPVKIVRPDVVLAFDPGGADPDCPLIVRNTSAPGPLSLDATRLADELFGSHLVSNTMLMGFAWQAGLIPISRASIEQAIRWNGVAVDKNLQAFAWGRACFAGHKPGEQKVAIEPVNYVAALTAYQNAAYAREFASFIAGVPEPLRETVSLHLYRLMAYKDEYEVARLLTQPGYEGVSYNLHPPFLRALGLKRKIRLGPWFRPALRILASMKFLRGTPLDAFGYAKHRREERALIGWYRELVRSAIDHPRAEELISLPAGIRGYDDIKSRSIAESKRKAAEILACESSPSLSSVR